MSQQIDNDNIERDSSVLEAQDSRFTFENNLVETNSEPVRKAEVDKKRSFSERWQTNRFWLVRGSYHFLRSVWTIVMVIGGFIVWLISLLFI